MKKRVISVILVLILAVSSVLTVGAVNAQTTSGGSFNNFKVIKTYTSGQFRDIESASWYAMYVQTGYEFGYIKGKTSALFAPNDRLTYAEAIKIACCINKIYYTGKSYFSVRTPWYKAYVDYALKNGIIKTPPSNYSKFITRAVFAEMIAAALPANAFSEISQITDNAIPDVSLSDGFASAVYMLYRSGILTGCDSFGTFYPNHLLSRAEAVAITARLSAPDFRNPFVLPTALSGEDIFKKCVPAVFYLERYDSEGVLLGIGSGFFITRDGLAVTNYHVIDGAASAMITTADGKTYAVKGICGYDKKTDLAILQIDGSDFHYLSIADSDALEAGSDIYVIGSPFGLINTISDGIISNTIRDIDGTDFIQISAPISQGSGGGPVLNTFGQVIGVSCLTAVDGQNLNFAVPINKMNNLSRTGSVPLIAIVSKNADSTIYYRGYYPVPDYGVFTGTPLFETQYDEVNGTKTYFYKLSDITVSDEIAVDGYGILLAQNGFTWQSAFTNTNGYAVDVYYNAIYGIFLHFGSDVTGSTACHFIRIY